LTAIVELDVAVDVDSDLDLDLRSRFFDEDPQTTRRSTCVALSTRIAMTVTEHRYGDRTPQSHVTLRFCDCVPVTIRRL
jgi:hypothetical protein